MSERLTTTLLLPTLNEIEAVRVIIPQMRKEWVDEIIVIDGGSTDGTVEFMRSAGLRVHSQTSRGYGQGMLQGMHLAKGDIVVEFTPGRKFDSGGHSAHHREGARGLRPRHRLALSRRRARATTTIG